LERITKYEYNLFDQVIAEKWYESDDTTLDRTISSEYDDTGNLLSSDEPNAASYDFVYDELGRRTDETQTLEHLSSAIIYTSDYDVNGFRTSLAATVGTTDDFLNSYRPDNLGRLTSLVQKGQSGGVALADEPALGGTGVLASADRSDSGRIVTCRSNVPSEQRLCCQATKRLCCQATKRCQERMSAVFTYDSRDFELREAFRVRVWEVNDLNSEVIVEVRIVDKDAPLYEFATVEYQYDHQNQMVGRVFDVDGEGEENPTYTFYSYQDGQVV
jgi:YD repeat-containing protein